MNICAHLETTKYFVYFLYSVMDDTNKNQIKKNIDIFVSFGG